MWKALEPHFGYKLGKSITRADCQAYTAKRRRDGRTNSTIRTELESLRACLRWHYGKDAPGITAPPPSKARDHYLTKAMFETFLEAIETPHVRLFVVIAMTTGARAGAILDLKWEQVNFDLGTIDFNPAGRDITNKRRTIVPINARLRAALKEGKGAAISDYVIEYAGEQIKSVKTALIAASRRSGIKCSPHVLRHSAAVWMAQADVSLDKIAQYLGHTTPKLTYSTYARFQPGFMADAAAALDW